MRWKIPEGISPKAVESILEEEEEVRKKKVANFMVDAAVSWNWESDVRDYRDVNAIDPQYREPLKFLIWGEGYMEYMPEEYQGQEQKYHSILDLSSEERQKCLEILGEAYRHSGVEAEYKKLVEQWNDHVGREIKSDEE